MSGEGEALAASRAALARARGEAGESQAEPSPIWAGLPDWIGVDGAPPEARESPPSTPLPAPLARAAEAVRNAPRGPADPNDADTPAVDARPVLTRNERAMRRRLAASGFVIFDGDEQPPTNTPDRTYKTSTVPGSGTIRGGRIVGWWDGAWSG